MKKRLYGIVLWWLMTCGLCFMLQGCIIAKQPEVHPVELSSEAVREAEEPEQELEPEPEPAPIRITLVAVGDNLLHMPIVRWCETADGYDFTPLYAEVKELVSAADIAFVNQESPLGGEGFAPSGYPLFNSPQEAGLALADTGFNVINHANNHALDKGAKAVLATADFWQDVPDVAFIGVHRSEEEQQMVTVVEAQGCRFAWLAYSYGTNGMPMAYGYLMNLINKDAIAADIERARALADAVIVSMHWGNEYQLTPSPEQRELAQFLADQGVMLVIGHHPHVVQPLEWLTGKDGNATLVMYSLGNFVSNQSRRNTMLEGMLFVAFWAKEDEIVIEECGVLPMVMHYERGYTAQCVYPFAAYSDDLARRHYINQLDRPVSLDFFGSLAREAWGDYCMLEFGE